VTDGRPDDLRATGALIPEGESGPPTSRAGWWAAGKRETAAALCHSIAYTLASTRQHVIDRVGRLRYVIMTSNRISLRTREAKRLLDRCLNGLRPIDGRRPRSISGSLSRVLRNNDALHAARGEVPLYYILGTVLTKLQSNRLVEMGFGIKWRNS